MSLEALALEYRNDRHRDHSCGGVGEYGHGWRSQTLKDEVRPPRMGHALRDALGYTLMDEVRPKGRRSVLGWKKWQGERVCGM